MKRIRTIAMNTDHTYHGTPCEVTRVELFMSEEMMTSEVVEIAKRFQVERLHNHAKRMPHRYWQRPEERPYADELRAPLDGTAGGKGE